MEVAFDKIGEVVATFEAAEGVTVGKAVKITASGQVGPCSAEGDVPAGVAVSLRNGLAGVQLYGYVELPCAATLTVGFGKVSMDASGKVQPDTDGRPALVVYADSTAGQCGLFL